jgi:hypothetical protein
MEHAELTKRGWCLDENALSVELDLLADESEGLHDLKKLEAFLLDVSLYPKLSTILFRLI